MGLDNIPFEYPCRRQHTAVLSEDGRIDCDQTIAAGQCPWKREAPARGAIYGMMGTYCWYRGKAGMWMLERLEDAGYEPPWNLYPTQDVGEDEPDITPAQAQELHEWLVAHAEAYANLINNDLSVPEAEKTEELHGYRYMTWWVGWCAREAGGIDAWY